jgi:hypothetical protein
MGKRLKDKFAPWALVTGAPACERWAESGPGRASRTVTGKVGV